MSEIPHYDCSPKLSSSPKSETSDAHLWGLVEVKARLKEAAQALRALGLNCRDRPANLIAHWPGVVRQGFEAYGYETVRQRPLMPSAADISRADETVLWLLWLDDAAPRIVWARASGVAWRQLENKDGRSHTTLRRIEAKGFEEICRRLNATLDPRQAVAAAFRQGRENRAPSRAKL